ncbi:MAG: bacteriohemerythrin [Negativicutes bacterium]|nr:bacteriohemerythrin [Negativicutes bacterium]
MVKWRDSFSVGIAEVDREHMELINIFNEIHQLKQDRLRLDKFDGIIEILGRLSDYTVRHFETEETIMQRYNYPEYAQHKKEHEDFMAQVNNIDVSQIDFEQDSYLRGIMDYVGNWLCDHILDSDRRMGDYVCAVK